MLLDWIICNLLLGAIVQSIITALLGKLVNIKIGFIFGIPITVGLLAAQVFKVYFGIGC